MRRGGRAPEAGGSRGPGGGRREADRVRRRHLIRSSRGRGAQLCQPPFKKAPLGAVVGQRPRPTVGGERLLSPAQAPEQLGPGRMEVPVVVEAQPIDDPESGFGAIHLGDGDRPVQLDDRRVGETGELAVAVEDGDLKPVALVFGMQ